MSRAYSSEYSSLKRLVEATGLGVWEYDFAQNRQTWSDSLCAMLGYTQADTPSGYDAWLSMLHADDRPTVQLAAQQALDSEKPFYEAEYRIRTGRGQWLWIHAVGHVTERDAEGNPLRVLGTMADISARKLSERVLRAQRDLAQSMTTTTDAASVYREIVASALALSELDAGSLYMADAQGRYTQVSDLGFTDALRPLMADLLETPPLRSVLSAPCAVCACDRTDVDCRPADLLAQLPLLRASGVQSLLVFPIESEGRVQAWLALCNLHAPLICTDSMTTLPLLAASFSQALHNLQMKATQLQTFDLLRTVLDENPNIILMKDWQGRFVMANKALAGLYGTTPDEMIGKDDGAYNPNVEQVEFYRKNVQGIMQRGQTEVVMESSTDVNTGQVRYYQSIKKPLLAPDGQPRILVIANDVTELQQAQLEIETGAQRLATVINGFPGAVLLEDATRHIVLANPAFCEMFVIPVPAEMLTGLDCSNAAEESKHHFADEEAFVDGIGRILKDRKPVLDEEVRLKNGRTLTRDFLPILKDDQFLGHLWLYRDITARKQSESQLRLMASVFEHAHESIVITDANAHIVEVNAAFTELTGYHRDEVLGKNPSILQSGHQSAAFYEGLWHDINQHGFWHGEIWNRKKNGELYAEMNTISAVRQADGDVSHYVGISSDITAQKKQQTQLERLAHFDALTQLPNRVLLADRLNMSINQAQRSGEMLAICYLDLDGFKEVNDTLGHEAGDRLLVEVAQRLQGCLRSGDTVARLGGDEFVLLMGNLQSLDEVSNALSRILAALASPYMLRESMAHISASAGVTLYPPDGSDADTLIRHADQAMYQAKLAGRNRYHLFDPEQDRRVATHRMAVERISRGLDAEEFVLHYQPRVDMRRGVVLGMEALIRWQHPEDGLLPPSAFLYAANEGELAVRLGNWVLDEAIHQACSWHSMGLALGVNINIAAAHLQHEGFVERLRTTLADCPDLPPERIELEILESTALEDMVRVNDTIAACHEIGVKVALDDFGTGYSSLTYFRRLPVDTLKIDQSFVRDMLIDDEDYAIVEGVIGLTQAFGRHLVAEGVETPQHGMLLLKMGCDEAQGYGIARPMPALDVSDWVANFKPDPIWSAAFGLNLEREDLILLVVEQQYEHDMNLLMAHLTDETGQAPIVEFDAHSCHFGRWYAGQGYRRYGDLPEFKRVGDAHRLLHTQFDALKALKWAGNDEAVSAGMPAFIETRKQVASELTDLVLAVSSRNEIVPN